MEDKQLVKPAHFDESEQIGDQLFRDGCILQAIQVYKRIIEQGYKIDFQIQGLGFFDHCDRRYEWFAYRWYDQQRKNGKIRGNVFDVLSLCFGLIKNKQEMAIEKGILWYQDMLAKRQQFQLYVGYAHILNNKGRYEEAIKVYNKILKIKPHFLNAYVAIAMIYEFSRIQKTKAIQMANKAIEIDPNNMYALFVLGKNEKDVEDRISKLIENHNKWPEYVRNTNQVGLAFGAKKDSKQAIFWYKKCLQIAPQNAQTYNNIGYRLSVLKQYSQSLSWFFKACEWDHKYKQALLNAIDTFKALKLTPNNIIEEMGKYPNIDHFFFYYYLGLAYFDKKQVNTAIQWYKRAEALSDQNYALYNSMGLAYQNNKDYENGEKYYNKSININPKYHYPYYNLGLLQKHRGNLQKAIEWYKKAIQVNARYHPPYNNLGNIYKDRGEYEKAIDCYRECVQIHSTYTLVYANMGICLLNQQRYQEAFNAFSRSKELLPTDNNGLNQANKSFLKEHLDKFDKQGEKWRKTSSISYDQKQNLRYLIQSYQSKFKQELSNMNGAIFSNQIVISPEMIEALNLIMEDQFGLNNIKDIFRCVKALYRRDEQHFQIIPQLFIQFFLKNHYSLKQSIKCIEKDLENIVKYLRIDINYQFLDKGIENQEIKVFLLKIGYPSACSVNLFKETSFFDSYEALYAQIERINKLMTGSLREFSELVESVRVRSNGVTNKVTMALSKRTQLQFPTMMKIIQSILRDQLNQQWKSKLLQKIANTLKKQQRPTQIGIIHEVIDIWINEITIILKQRFKNQIETKCNINDLLSGKIQFEKISDIILALEACANQCRLHGYEILAIQNNLPLSQRIGIKISVKIGQAVCQLNLAILQDDTRSQLLHSISELQGSPLGFIFGSYLFMSKGFNYPLLLNCKHIEERLKVSSSAEDQKTLLAARYLIEALESNNQK